MNGERLVKFFGQWNKGTLCLINGTYYEGVVEEFLPAETLGNSTIKLSYFKKNDKIAKASTKKNIPLSKTDYFEAVGGPIFNIKKYLSENEQGELKRIVCVAFDMEFYASEKTASLLKTRMKKLLFSQLKDLALITIEDQTPTDLTPTFSQWVRKVKLRFREKETLIPFRKA